MKNAVAALLASALIATPALAQNAAPAATAPQAQPAVMPVQSGAETAVAVAAPAMREVQLPANSEVVLALNGELSSKTHRVGDKFSLTVAKDVVVDNMVVIPRGTRAIGQVTWRTGTGGFGKSGKMEVAFRYLEMNNLKVPVEGSYRQDGEGNTAATVGAVLAAGVIGGLIVKGKSARVPEGREFSVRTVEAIPMTMNGSTAAIAASYVPKPVSMQIDSKKAKRGQKADKASGKTVAKKRA
jgi:hypothetical protein